MVFCTVCCCIDAEIKNAFANATPENETGYLGAGDFVLVQIPRNNSLYLIKIISANPDENPHTTGKHVNGVIKFDYRKVGAANNS